MALNPRILRKLFATGAVLALLIAAVFYLRGIIKSQRPLEHLPKKIPENIARSGAGFTYSQSAGSKTLFTIHAASFQQYKEPGRVEGGKAELHDVSIIVYGRDDNRSDQIYGSEFVYDPASGDVTASGEVHIDLAADSSVAAGGSPGPAPERGNFVHVNTSGLTFNRKSGIAQTKQKIEFRFPGASGSAVGANYNSHQGVLTLDSAVKITTTEKQKATITGRSATITRDPREIVLHGANIEQPQRTVSADQVEVLLRDDSTVERVAGSGHLHAVQRGEKAFEITASQGALLLAGNNQPRSARISGGVDFASRGQPPAQGRAQNILLTFGPRGEVTKARAQGAVDFSRGATGQSEELQAAAVDLYVQNGKRLHKAVTSDGPARILATQQATRSTITAGKFEAHFDAQNRMRSVVGTPDATIVSSTPGQPERTASAHQLTANFSGTNEITSADLTGNFHYQEGQRSATADRARYNVEEGTYFLSGSPRVVESGASLSAESLLLNRKTGMVYGKGSVKTTYNDFKSQPNGAMLGSSEPVHVTGTSFTASQGAGTARYTAARLWQGANIVEAPSLTFDKIHRSLQAKGSQSGRVTSVFLESDKNGKSTPLNVTADRLSYVDAERKAVFSGNVLIRSAGAVMNADTVQVLLLARSGQGGSQLDRIVAEGDIRIEQGDRRATGERMIYTAQEQKFVLTGSKGHPPSIFDAEHGRISGDSLTFYTQGDKVLVGSGDSAKKLTPTRTRDASKK